MLGYYLIKMFRFDNISLILAQTYGASKNVSELYTH